MKRPYNQHDMVSFLQQQKKTRYKGKECLLIVFRGYLEIGNGQEANGQPIRRIS